MSDDGGPKALRFTKEGVQVRAPSWLPVSGGGEQPPRRMEPPRVPVSSIDGAAHEEGMPGNASRPLAWEPVANQNAPVPSMRPAEQQADLAEIERLKAELAEAQAELGTLKASLEERAAELREQADRFARATIDMGSARAEVLAEVEGQLLELSVMIAEAIIEDELAGRPELHQALVEAALAHLSGERKLVLRASPDAYDAIVECLGGTDAELGGTQLSVRVDRELHGLGCVLESENRRVDGRVSERLLAIRRGFLSESQRRQEEAS